MSIAAGMYKGRAIAGSEQYGSTSNGNDQIVIDLTLTGLDMPVSTFLVFTDASAQFSIDRLRALGWEGNDLTSLRGIDKNEVDVIVKYEMYQGEQKMKVDIMTGGGRVTIKEPMNDAGKRAFAARFKALASTNPGSGGGSGGDAGGFPFGANAPPQRAGGVKL